MANGLRTKILATSRQPPTPGHHIPAFRGQLILFLLFSSIVINCAIYAVAPVGFNNNTLIHTWDTLNLRNIYDDSWGVMRQALDYLTGHAPLGSNTPVYSKIFFEIGRKFQYPLSALIPFYILENHLDLASAIFFTLMVVALVLTVEIFWRQKGLPVGSVYDIGLRSVATVVAAFTFYPLVKAFTLGQIQVWLNSLFAISVLAWICGRRGIAGALLGLFVLVKPHFGLFLLWGIVRREWRFVVACMAVCIVGLGASLVIFGWRNNIDYLNVLSYISSTPESFYPNNSLGALLNRFIGRGRPDIYDNINSDLFFPPYNAWVHAISTIGALVILVPAIFIPLSSRDQHGIEGYCLMAVSCVVASPIAWEHHYGVLFPVFILVYIRLLAAGGRGIAALGVLYILASNHLQFLNLLADSPFNFVQNYLWFSGLGLLLFLYGLLPPGKPASRNAFAGHHDRA
ncbi:glycosyltransferase family 87 protein [Kaistia terrae]|uniref:Glycosyltransferase family 87 protein n=1 Tax=Kaistia terrae TaxID=537017 RepID=A0ABW0PZN2_9HYPH|nr:glycosyltransferase family 87 protein [Kaistia terrae]MCX5578952.1 glycosyltransferase family 87 protein [Kaistia terrae]